jgi:hypothetical protein
MNECLLYASPIITFTLFYYNYQFDLFKNESSHWFHGKSHPTAARENCNDTVVAAPLFDACYCTYGMETVAETQFIPTRIG